MYLNCSVSNQSFHLSLKCIPVINKDDGKSMQKLDLKSCQQPKHAYKCGGNERLDIPNHLDSQFAEVAPNKVWCYLAVVMSLFSRKVIGWQCLSPLIQS